MTTNGSTIRTTLTPAELIEAKVAAARQGVSLAAWATALIRREIGGTK